MYTIWKDVIKHCKKGIKEFTYDFFLVAHVFFVLNFQMKRMHIKSLNM